MIKLTTVHLNDESIIGPLDEWLSTLDLNPPAGPKPSPDDLWGLVDKGRDTVSGTHDKYKLKARSPIPLRKKIEEYLREEYVGDERFVYKSGSGLYPPNGYMGWHTNILGPGTRYYFNWANKEGESGLRYWYKGTPKVIRTSFDSPGWQLRIFDISNERPLWHYVFSNCTRVSLGFRAEFQPTIKE